MSDKIRFKKQLVGREGKEKAKRKGGSSRKTATVSALRRLTRAPSRALSVKYARDSARRDVGRDSLAFLELYTISLTSVGDCVPEELLKVP